MDPKPVLLSQKTYISLGLIAALGGFIGWLTNINHIAHSNSRQIEEIKQEVKDNKTVFLTIEKRLGTIEGKLDIMLREKSPR